jgi:DNA-binding response OmpR family regulator
VACEIRNILIIDDNPDICEVVKIILSKAGYQARAMEHFEPFDKTEAPDMILLDIKMNDQDGTQICRQLKNKKPTSNIPVIIFSASPDIEAAAHKAGADDFIAKPFKIRDLLRKIEHFKES